MRISQNFFAWFHPSWSSVSETKIKIPGPKNPSPALPLLSLCLWDRVQTGAETVPSAEFHRSKRVKWRKNICAKLSCWWYIGHGSCPANHFLKVNALGPPLLHHPGAKTLRRKNHHGAGTEGCSKWRCHDELKSRHIKTKIIQLLAFLDDERGKHARQYIFTRLDEGRSLAEKSRNLRTEAVRRFSATLTCA